MEMNEVISNQAAEETPPDLPHPDTAEMSEEEILNDTLNRLDSDLRDSVDFGLSEASDDTETGIDLLDSHTGIKCCPR